MKSKLKRRSDFRQELIILMYRIAHWSSRQRKRSKYIALVAVPILIIYRVVTEWFFMIEIPAATEIGEGLLIDHGYSIVINKHAIIGKNCRLRHSVTIGCKVNSDGTQGPSPRIGNGVDIGAGAIIIGGIWIGDNSVIGAGAVVTKDVPPGAVVVGNPARIIRIKPEKANDHIHQGRND